MTTTTIIIPEDLLFFAAETESPFSPLVDDIAYADCRENLKKVGSYATVEASKTFILYYGFGQ